MNVLVGSTIILIVAVLTLAQALTADRPGRGRRGAVHRNRLDPAWHRLAQGGNPEHPASDLLVGWRPCEGHNEKGMAPRRRTSGIRRHGITRY